MKKVTANEKENFMNRNFITTAINQKCCMDIMYIYKKEEWLYFS